MHQSMNEFVMRNQGCTEGRVLESQMWDNLHVLKRHNFQRPSLRTIPAILIDSLQKF